MSQEDLERLCKSCGMCCDGTLFQRAMLKPEEVEPAKKHGLKVIEDRGFEQPCPQWTAGGCQVYEHRPSVCRSFACKLFVRHRDQGGPIELRLKAVKRVRFLMEVLDRAGLERTPNGEVKFTAEGADAFEAMGAFAELMERLEDDFARATPATAPDRSEPPPTR
jgi:Fe-S-cluster containining protein